MALQFTGNRNAKMSSVVAIDYDHVVNKPNILLYEPQSLTDEQKEQARENVGAGPDYWDLQLSGTFDRGRFTPNTGVGYATGIALNPLHGDTLQGLYTYGAVNTYGFQGLLAFTYSADLPDIFDPGEYVASTAAIYGVAENNYTAGIANVNVFGAYLEGRAANNYFTCGAELDVQNVTGLAPRLVDPNNIFGVSGGAPLTYALWLANSGTKAPFGVGDNSAAIGIPGDGTSVVGRFLRGIVFAAGSLKGDSGNVEVLSVPAQYQVAWYNSAETSVGRLSSTGSTLRYTADLAPAFALGSTAAPQGTLDIRGGAGTIQLVCADITTDATGKTSRIATAHYTNSEEPMAMLMGSAGVSGNTLNIGGGTGAMNAATTINFYTASNNTTTTGSVRASINSSGLFSFNNGIALNGSSSGAVGLAAPAAAGSTTYTLPSADGSANMPLVTNGSAALSFGSSAQVLSQNWRTPYVFYISGAAASITGTTTETTLASTTIPANALGANGALRITPLWGATGTNTKTLRVKLGGTAFVATALTTQLSAQNMSIIRNTNATNSQVSTPAVHGNGGLGGSSAAVTMGSVDTTTSQTLEFTAQLTNTGESATFYGALVEIIYSA